MAKVANADTETMGEAETTVDAGSEETKKKKDAVKKASVGAMFSLASPGELLLLFVGTLGAIGNGTLQPMMILLWGDMIDEMGAPVSADAAAGSMDQMMSNMTDTCIDFVIFGILALVAGSIQGFCFKKFSEAMLHKMLLQYYSIVLHSDIEWFDAQDPAALPLSMISSATKFSEAWGDKLGTSIMALATFISGYILAFVKGWPIALVMAGTLPFLAVGAVVMGSAMESVQKETQGWYAKAAAVVEETFYAIRTVVAFGGEKKEIQRYTVAVTAARKGGVNNGVKIGIGLGYTMGICFLAYALAYYVGMRFRYDDIDNPGTGEPWTGGEILGVFFCVLIASFMVGTIDPGVKAFEAARVSAATFFDARDKKPVIQCRTTDDRKDITAITKFELQNVTFYYPAKPEVTVLDGLSLSVERGQKVAFVGESGSGKSTVMSLLERFYDVQQGSILVNGTSIKEYSIKALRRCIGYVGQEPVLFATSIRENIISGTTGVTNEVLQKAIQDAQVSSFVNGLEDKLETDVGAGGLKMSGGQKQRIAIARALVKGASTLFLDEATSALDNTSEKDIQKTIDNLTSGGESSYTVVIIAHRLSTIRNVNTIFVMKQGRLQEQGTYKELMEKEGMFHALVATQETPAADEASPGPERDDSALDVRRGASGNAQDMVETKAGKTEEEKAKEQADRDAKIAKEYKVPMGRLLKFCKPEWPLFIPAVIGALYDGASQPISGILLVEAIVAMTKDKEAMKEEIHHICIWFVLLAIGEFIFVIIAQASLAYLGESLTMRLRIAIFDTVFQQEIGFHDDPDHSPGSLAAALEIYSFRVSNLCKSIGNKAGVFGALIVGIGLAFVYSWQIALILLGAVPIIIGANALQMVVMLGGSGTENERIKAAQQVVSESVQNARTVHACGSENALVALYTKKVLAGQTPVIKLLLAGIAFGLSGAVFFFIMAGAFYIMGLFLKDATSDFRDLMIAFMCVMLGASGAGQAASMMGDATKATVATHDAFLLLDRKSEINGMSEDDGRKPNPGAEGTKSMGTIKFQDVQFHYPFRPAVKVLKGVNFEVEAGQSIGVVGPSGGGKSTIMALLQRYYDPMEGAIFYNGNAVKDLNVRWWRQQIGYVGQEPILFNTTVRENVQYGLVEGDGLTDDQLNTHGQNARIDFLGEEGWGRMVGPRGSHLSGGQKQRVSICRALVRDPPILLLDEATSALDSQSEKVVQDALEAARAGRTCFSIAHRLSSIQHSDSIMVVAEGTILERGTHTELMEKEGVYTKLYRASQR